MVEYLKYNDQKIPVRCGYSALVKFKEETGVDFTDEDKEEDIRHHEPMLYYSILSGFKAIKKECTISRNDMEDVLDECLFDWIEMFPKFFPENIQKKVEGNRQQRRLTAKQKK